MHQPPFAHEFDIIGLFDVLEHLPDDRRVLNDLKRMLRDDGVLVLTAPAHSALWSYFDEASRHCRRYRPDDLNRKLIEAGYKIEYTTQFMMSLWPLVWIRRHLSSLDRRVSTQQNGRSAEELAVQELHVTPIINEALSQFLNIEGHWLASGHTLPLGTSLLVVARNHL
jgi:SAM-dependent methyltransferase